MVHCSAVQTSALTWASTNMERLLDGSLKTAWICLFSIHLAGVTRVANAQHKQPLRFVEEPGPDPADCLGFSTTDRS